MASSWYKTGFSTDEDDDTTGGKLWKPNRFWMKPKGQADIVFVDSVPIRIYEHQLNIDGDFKNWFTCLRGTDEPCPVCEINEESRAHVGLLTIVDGTSWTNKRGETTKWEVKLIAGKSRTLKVWLRKNDTRKENGSPGGIANCLFKVARDDEKTPNCGSDFEFVRGVDPNGLFEQAMYSKQKLTSLYDNAEKNEKDMTALKKIFQLEFAQDGKLLRKIVPFNYYELLKPLPLKELQKRTAHAKFDSKDGASAGNAEEVPF